MSSLASPHALMSFTPICCCVACASPSTGYAPSATPEMTPKRCLKRVLIEERTVRNTRATSATDTGEAGEAAHTPDDIHLEPARAPVTSASLRQTRVPDDEDIHPDG